MRRASAPTRATSTPGDLLLGHAGVRDGPNVSMQAFDTVERVWKTVNLNKAVYVTTAEGDLVFESDGNGITRR